MTNTDIQAGYVGSSEAVRMYLGTNIVWEKQSPVPPGPDLPFSAQPFTIEITDTSGGNEINFNKIVAGQNSTSAVTSNAPNRKLYYTINIPFTLSGGSPWRKDGQYDVHVLESNGTISGLSSGDTIRFYTFVESVNNQDYPPFDGTEYCGPFGTSANTGSNVVPTNSFGHSTASFIVYGNILSLITCEWTTLIRPIPYTTFEELSWAKGTRPSSYNIFNGLFATSGTNVSVRCKLYDAENLVLPQDTKYGCYAHMFKRTRLVENPPVLPATGLSSFCYVNMFDGCADLREAPELPATIMKPTCYGYMFSKCTTLEVAPELPATDFTVGAGCYSNMFNGCTMLREAPELPATTLISNCYLSMFQGCRSMTGTPVLPATTLPSRCYYRMFNGCRQISEIICLATNPTTGACDSWLQGASTTGTFHKASGVTWPSGTSGIPTGWTTEDYVEPASENTGQ